MTNLYIWLLCSNLVTATWTQPAAQPYARTDGVVLEVPQATYYDAQGVVRKSDWINAYLPGHKAELSRNVTKKPLVIKCEAAYVSLYTMVFQDQSYTNASRDEVASRFADIMAVNPQVAAFSFPMWQAFDEIQSWWVNQGAPESFHPYPWGLTNVTLYYDMTWQE